MNSSSKMTDGYQTKISERGSSLSGVKDRELTARAFLKDAPILILDEATSCIRL